MPGACPVLLLTGALGSGKSTLLSRLVDRPEMASAVVIVNELGDVVLDHHLVRETNEDTLVLSSGCVCCSLRGDLVDELRDLLTRRSRGTLAGFDRVVIETTGIADPAPVIQTLLVEPLLRHQFVLERVVTAVDALNGPLASREGGAWLQQVTAADRLAVTKGDLADPAPIEAVLARVNPTADIVRATFGELDPGVVFGSAEPVRVAPALSPHSAGHPEQVQSFTVELLDPVDWSTFGIWLSMLLRAHGDDVLRVKGLLDLGGAGPLALDCVRHVVHRPEHLRRWPPGSRGRSQLLFITRSLSRERIAHSLWGFLNRYGRRALATSAP